MGISASEFIAEHIANHGLDAANRATAKVRGMPNEFEFEEEGFEELATRLLDDGKVDVATTVLLLAVELLPESWICRFHLAAAYMHSGEKARAAESLEAVLKRNERFWLAEFILSDLDQRIERVRREQDLLHQTGDSIGVTGPYLGQEPPGMTAKLFAPHVVSKSLALNFGCSFSPDGMSFYFNHFMNLMECHWGSEGWTAPAPAAFAQGRRALESHIVPDGGRIFFRWFPPDEEKGGIYVCNRLGSNWSEPAYVGQGGSLSTTRDGQVFVSERTRGGFDSVVREAVMEKGQIAQFKPLSGGLANLEQTFPISSHPCISPDGKTLLFDTSMRSGLFASFRDAYGAWSKPLALSDHGLSPLAGIANFTLDGEYLFFNSAGDIYWIRAEFVERLRRFAQR